MGAIRILIPVKLFIGVLVSDTGLLAGVESRLIESYGPLDHSSPVLQFKFTRYYEHEMGTAVHRIFFSFERLIEADHLSEIKRQTNRIEQEMAPLLKAVKRPVNLDPGYMEQAKVILASTKNFSHRSFCFDSSGHLRLLSFTRLCATSYSQHPHPNHPLQANPPPQH